MTPRWQIGEMAMGSQPKRPFSIGTGLLSLYGPYMQFVRFSQGMKEDSGGILNGNSHIQQKSASTSHC